MGSVHWVDKLSDYSPAMAVDVLQAPRKHPLAMLDCSHPCRIEFQHNGHFKVCSFSDKPCPGLNACGHSSWGENFVRKDNQIMQKIVVALKTEIRTGNPQEDTCLASGIEMSIDAQRNSKRFISWTVKVLVLFWMSCTVSAILDLRACRIKGGV